MSIYSDHQAHYEKASRHAALYDKRMRRSRPIDFCGSPTLAERRVSF